VHQLAADLESEPVELEQWPAAGGSGTVNRAQRLADLGKNPGRFQDNGQLYDRPATRDAGGGVINWQLDTKKAALRPL
jgi:hypothetical protein